MVSRIDNDYTIDRFEIDPSETLLADTVTTKTKAVFAQFVADQKENLDKVNRQVPFHGVAPLPIFIESRKALVPFLHHTNVIMVCSSGRSGSTMLSLALMKKKSRQAVIKSHLLPPDPSYKGKIIFIYSDPNKAAESALHQTIQSDWFGLLHFRHVESADRRWFEQLKSTTLQTEEQNLLSYDALGCYEHLNSWLHTQTVSCPKEEAKILAVKYEDLWQSVDQIRAFTGIVFTLPPKKPRGYKENLLSLKEIRFKEKYNLGTEEKPIYKAYDAARTLWEQAPPIQYLKLRTEK